MFSYFCSLNPIVQSLIAGSFTFFITLLGSAIVFFFKNVNHTVMDSMMAISAGIMLSASFFSLLSPAIELADSLHLCTWAVLLLGFLIGGVLLFLGDKLFDYLSRRKKHNFQSNLKRSIMLFSSITLHNIPEGLVLGVAFGSVVVANSGMAGILSAITLTIGIAIQNFPEGSAISLPLRRDGASITKAFLFGSLSAIVEPIFAVIGAILVLKIQTLLPFIMSFTAGAMMFVVLMELIPEIQQNKRKDIMSLLIMIGFSIMMILEITLG